MSPAVTQVDERVKPLAKQMVKGPPRAPKRNFHRIHALPLPLKVHPLPTLIPHNPLSILSIVLTYLVQTILQPSSHQSTRYLGHYSTETQSIHVTDPRHVRALWEMGFFGKGSLSRSEPNWLDKEKRRRGLLAQETSEEVVKKRRQERKEFKNERAKKEREAIDEKLIQEGKLNVAESASKHDSGLPSTAGNGHVDAIATDLASTHSKHLNGSLEGSEEATQKPSGLTATNGDVPSEITLPPLEVIKSGLGRNGSGEAQLQPPPTPSTGRLTADVKLEQPVQDVEHLQLTQEEALFLVYGLGVLDIMDESTQDIIPATSLLPLFRRQSYFPPFEGSSLPLDDPFMLSYVVYHHFRSLGWVVRPGMKFAVDFLLYNRGPVFAHAEFAVIIVPSYDHPHYSSSPSARDTVTSTRGKNWWWLHCVNRVQAQVHKNLILVYVEIPPPTPDVASHASGLSDDDSNITELLKRYKVREFSLKRWTPNRGRD